VDFGRRGAAQQAFVRAAALSPVDGAWSRCLAPAGRSPCAWYWREGATSVS